MQRTLSHRHSYPPPSRLLSLPESLPASPAAAVDPATTTTTTTTHTTPSSRFSEIEQVEPPHPPAAHHAPRIEPFVSPLTEANLKYHTHSYPTSREARNVHVEHYVDSQASVVQLEAELQRRRRAEIRSLVPLDTLSTSDEVIVQPMEPIEPTCEEATKKRRKWYRFRNPFKKNKAQAEKQTTTHVIPLRNSWAPDSSYEHYQSEKLEIMHEGLCGLNNVNIIRALGGDGPVVALTPPQQQQQQQQQQELKRDSGVSFGSLRRKRFSVRLGALREDDHEQNMAHASTLVGVRYPKMIHRQTLRDAAIHVLSSDVSLWDQDDADQDYARSKRFSDPGMMFSAP